MDRTVARQVTARDEDQSHQRRAEGAGGEDRRARLDRPDQRQLLDQIHRVMESREKHGGDGDAERAPPFLGGDGQRQHENGIERNERGALVRPKLGLDRARGHVRRAVVERRPSSGKVISSVPARAITIREGAAPAKQHGVEG